jgi:putative sigma-54 modulation protein
MHITITGVHLEITDAIRNYTLEKIGTLEKYVSKNDSGARIEVELSKTTHHHTHGDVFQAEANLHIRGKVSSVRTRQDDLYKAIDTLKDMLARELATHKDKERSIVRRGAYQVKQLLKRIIN